MRTMHTGDLGSPHAATLGARLGSFPLKLQNAKSILETDSKTSNQEVPVKNVRVASLLPWGVELRQAGLAEQLAKQLAC